MTDDKPESSGQAASFAGGQIGESHIGQVAGGDIRHGVDPDAILAFLREYVFLDRATREARQEITDTRHNAIRRILIIISAIVIVNSALLIIILITLRY